MSRLLGQSPVASLFILYDEPHAVGAGVPDAHGLAPSLALLCREAIARRPLWVARNAIVRTGRNVRFGLGEGTQQPPVARLPVQLPPDRQSRPDCGNSGGA